MDDTNLFNQERIDEITKQGNSDKLKDLTSKWMNT